MSRAARTPESTRLGVAIGDALKRLREHAGLTQTEVAVAIGSFQQIVARMEQGEHITDTATCARFATACGGSILDVTRAMDRVLEAGRRVA